MVDMRLDIRATRVSPDSSFCMPTTAQPAQTKKMAAPAQKQSLESEERGMLGMGIACTCCTHGFDPMCRKLTDQIRDWIDAAVVVEDDDDHEATLSCIDGVDEAEEEEEEGVRLDPHVGWWGG